MKETQLVWYFIEAGSSEPQNTQAQQILRCWLSHCCWQQALVAFPEFTFYLLFFFFFSESWGSGGVGNYTKLQSEIVYMKKR